MKKRDFWNICGRAGRAAKETEGQVIFVAISDRDSRFSEEYRDQINLERIDSALYKLLQALVERRISQDDLIGYLDSYVIAMLTEEIVDTQNEIAISDFLKDSLVGIQALKNGLSLDPLVSAIKSVSIWVANNVPDENLRRIFSSTGLRLKSCKELEKAVDSFCESVTEELLVAEECNLHYNESLLSATFRACQDLPEMKLKRNISYEGPEDEFKIIKAWISGKSIDYIRSQHWGDHSENFSEYISDRVVYKLPWGFNGFLRILSFKLGRTYEELPRVWQQLPTMTKFGVDNVFACWASSLGVSSRELALQLAEKYQYENGVSFADFTKWMVRLPTEFIASELEAPQFAKQRLMDVIDRISPDREHLEFIRGGFSELESPVRGIPYAGRQAGASNVKPGDQLMLELEPDNPYDPHAIKVMFNDEHIGYVQRDKAKIISKEMRLGRKIETHAKAVYPSTDSYPYAWIEMRISFE